MKAALSNKFHLVCFLDVLTKSSNYFALNLDSCNPPLTVCLMIQQVRELPDTYWRTLIPNTDAWSYEVTSLRPDQDYAFRVRTVSDTGMSEPSLPVYLYRKAGQSYCCCLLSLTMFLKLLAPIPYFFFTTNMYYIEFNFYC